MPFEVFGPDGKSVTFPDGTDDATVVRVMGGIYPSAAPAAAAPTAKTPSIDDTNILRDVPGALVSGLGQLIQFHHLNKYNQKLRSDLDFYLIL